MSHHLPTRIRVWLDDSHAAEVAALRAMLTAARADRDRALRNALEHQRHEFDLRERLDGLKRELAAVTAELSRERSFRAVDRRRADEAEEHIRILERRPDPPIEALREIAKLRRAYAASQNLLAAAEGRPVQRARKAVAA